LLGRRLRHKYDKAFRIKSTILLVLLNSPNQILELAKVVPADAIHVDEANVI
jgi:hypothetical protein